jgi:hypothetical protein
MWGSRDVLLRACYWRGGTDSDFTWTQRSRNGPSTSDAREVFYRVTGQSFNELPAPVVRDEMAWRSRANWDLDHGSDIVGQRLSGLNLNASRLDGKVFADAGLGYIEWTMVFKNDRTDASEARAQIALPTGGMISRLTLWVNGEPREAVFAGKSKVRKAYQEVAIRQRKDPVLITNSGTDRILMQCFPVPAGGEMKIRMGMSFPLQLSSRDEGRFRLPRLIEQNFGAEAQLQHHVWIQSEQPVHAAGVPIDTESQVENRWRGTLPVDGLNEPKLAIHAARNPDIQSTWCKDPHQPNRWITGQIDPPPLPQVPKKWWVVVDGARAIGEHQKEIHAALLAASENIAGIILATDKPKTMGIEEFGKVNFRKHGGEDNLPALSKAFEISMKDPVNILWIHGLQPIRLTDMQALEQTWTFNPSQAEIFSYTVNDGPNILLRDFEGKIKTTNFANFGNIPEDIQRGLEPNRTFAIKTTTTDSAPSSGKKVNDHLVRLWAFGEVNRLLNAPKAGERGTAVKTAAQYQLVTPVSGAVVLETDEQYAQNDLDPSDPASVPTIPEPETWMMLGLILIGLAVSTWKKKRRIRVR